MRQRARTRAEPGVSAPTRRRPERAILLACGGVGGAFVLLAVGERVGVDRAVLGALAVALPVAAVLLLALAGRTTQRLAAARDDGRASAFGAGLAGAGEWIGTWVVPAAVLLPLAGSGGGGTALLAVALALVGLALVLAPAMRRVEALTPAAFLHVRAGRRAGPAAPPSGPGGALLALQGVAVRWGAVAAGLAVAGGLLVFQAVLLHALLVPLMGGGADAGWLAMAGVAIAVLLGGGQRALTLVNAFLAFFLLLALVVPALGLLAGVGGLRAAPPLDPAWTRVLPAGGGGGPLLFAVLALAASALPSFHARLSTVRPGGLAPAGAWTLLAGYVAAGAVPLAFGAVPLAFGAAAVAGGPAISGGPDGGPSILAALPTLGWLGAVWAGATVSLWACVATLGDALPHGVPLLRLARTALERRRGRVAPVRRAPPPVLPGWLSSPSLALARLALLLVAVLAWRVWDDGLARTLTLGLAREGLDLVLLAGAGVLAPPLWAAALWSRANGSALCLGLATGALAAVLLRGTGLAPAAAALGAALANGGVIAATGFLLPPGRADVAALRHLRG